MPHRKLHHLKKKVGNGDESASGDSRDGVEKDVVSLFSYKILNGVNTSNRKSIYSRVRKVMKFPNIFVIKSFDSEQIPNGAFSSPSST